MQYIDHWPDSAQLTLPETVAQDLHRRLFEPFDSVASAKEFWQETSSTIIRKQHHDSPVRVDFSLSTKFHKGLLRTVSGPTDICSNRGDAGHFQALIDD